MASYEWLIRSCKPVIHINNASVMIKVNACNKTPFSLPCDAITS